MAQHSSIPPKINSDFIVNGTRCDGWLFLPENSKNPPVVIMAHGFAAEKTAGLMPFAERFIQNGLAVFLFDYRNFGGSDGTPRNLVSPKRHNQDWQAAIYHVQSSQGINTEKIALWGTSFAGGHVLVTAARNPQIKAVVSQIPFVDGFATMKTVGFKNSVQGTVEGLRDVFRMLTFRKPHYVPVASVPEEYGLMNTEDSLPGVLSILPDDSTWENKCPARVALSIPTYSPMRFANKVKCPTMIVLAEKDSLIPADAVTRTASRIKNCTLIRLDCGHFEPYNNPDIFEKTVKAETNFLVDHLTGSSAQ